MGLKSSRIKETSTGVNDIDLSQVALKSGGTSATKTSISIQTSSRCLQSFCPQTRFYHIGQPVVEPVENPAHDPVRDPVRDHVRDPVRYPVRDPALDHRRGHTHSRHGDRRHVQFYSDGDLSMKTKYFRDVVGPMLCGLLNSHGGSLYFGVTSEGAATGADIPQKREDELRLKIDNLIMDFQPIVPTANYAVHFTPIMLSGGQLSPDLKILHIIVKEPPTPDVRHAYKNVVYVIRNDRVQEMETRINRLRCYGE